MAEFNIRSDSIDIEQIMEQVRSRVREKRGVDYTEDQIRELATVKLDRFLDPKNVRSDLLEHYRKQYDQPSDSAPAAPSPAEPVATPPFEPVTVHPFEPDVVYQSSRSGFGRVLQAIRRTLRPVLKLLINPGPMLETLRALSMHAENTNRTLLVNEERHRLNEGRNKARAELDVLTYEVLNNLVVEMTRLAIDMKNHKMRVESVAARLDFDERRARALEEVVQYRAAAGTTGSDTAGNTPAPDGERGADGASEKRRRRRRRGRRRSSSESGAAAAAAASAGDDGAPAGGAGGAPAAGAGGEPADGAPSRDAGASAPAPTAATGGDSAPAADQEPGPAESPRDLPPAGPAAGETRAAGGEPAGGDSDP